jgi:hypothetical protein
VEDIEQALAEAPIEQIYQLLGNAVVNSIREPWETASLYAEIEAEDSGLIYGRYKTADTSDESCTFDSDEDVYFAFNELRHRLQRDGAEPWTLAHFALRSNGSFDLSFEYGPIPEDRDRP